MSSKSAVLSVKNSNEKYSLSLEWIDDSNLPESLNGESGFHIYHVRMLTELILKQLKKQGDCDLSEEDIKAISIAASLHDIGKSKIPKSILDFQGKLSP